MSEGGSAGGGGGAAGDVSNMFKRLSENVTTASMTLGNALQEYLQFKDELLQHKLPSNLLVSLTLTSSRLFRSYSDLCTPLGELSRLAQVHSSPWETKAEGLKKVRSDYESMKRKLNIALKKMEMMSIEASRARREKLLGHWERLFCHVMETKSHGRRWKFRIEPLRRKLEGGFNPYLSDSDSSEDEEDGSGAVEASESAVLRDQMAMKSVPHADVLQASSSELVSRETTPTPPPPPVETAEAATSTADPSYDNYLLIQMSRPNNILPKKDICCTISLGDKFYTSKIFPWTPEPDAITAPQVFYFQLSDTEAAAMPPTCKTPPPDTSLTKLLVGVYHKDISTEMSASVSLSLADIKTTEEPVVIVPPHHREEEEYAPDWDTINAGVSGVPVQYPLKLRGRGEEEEEEEVEEEIPAVPILFHRIKVQKHQHMESSCLTLPWEEVLEEMGYRKVAETQSRAASALPFDPTPSPPPVGPTGSEVRVEMEKETRGMLEAATLEHMRELREIQQQYEDKLNSLSKTLAKVKAEKNREIQDLEQTLTEMEKMRASGKKGKSMADIQRAIERRRKRISHGLPDWGKDLPDDFFERLELFKEESIRKQEELIDRIRKEVSEACEKQLATLHRLAPGVNREVDAITEDVTLPALFMPTPINKHLVYTPRAHKYFHPYGSHDNRVTQPPAIFKLPALQPGMQTLNLFELSQHFSQTGPQWLKESGQHPPYTPQLTPAPPPSACGYYHTHTVATQNAESAALAEDDDEEDSELDYGGLGGGTSGRAGERVRYISRPHSLGRTK